MTAYCIKDGTTCDDTCDACKERKQVLRMTRLMNATKKEDELN